MLNNVKLCGYKKPTPIQQYCIPAIKMGYDLIAVAQTGGCSFSMVVTYDLTVVQVPARQRPT